MVLVSERAHRLCQDVVHVIHVPISAVVKIRFSHASCAAVYAFMSSIFHFALTLSKMGIRN